MNQQQDLFAHLLPDKEPRHVKRLQKVQVGLPENLYLGTTSWANEDWQGLVYPDGCPTKDYIEHYSRAFRAVEIDSTWYRIPSERAIDSWLERTPEDFIFSAKVPRVVSHEKVLIDCLPEMNQFIAVMRRMGNRLGPLLMQFGYVARGKDVHENEYGSDFRRRLAGFLPNLPTDEMRFAVEVRNARWIRPELLDLLRAHNVALVLNCYYTMPDIATLRRWLDPVSADFLYLRFLGDRKKMDEYVEQMMQTGCKERHWDTLVLDRQQELQHWAKHTKELSTIQKEMPVFAFFNNHYAGYAPGSLGIFARAWKE